MMENKKLVFTAMSKQLFYFKDHILKFVIEEECVPLTPWAVGYFLLDTVPRDTIRNVNDTLVQRADELWVFGRISDGVLREIKLAKKLNKPIKYFEVLDSKDIKQISESEATPE